MKKFEVPDGWSRENMPHLAHCTVLHAPERAGMVTVDFERREFRLGYSVLGRRDNSHAYIGRGWRDELCKDAVEFLKALLAS